MLLEAGLDAARKSHDSGKESRAKCREQMHCVLSDGTLMFVSIVGEVVDGKSRTIRERSFLIETEESTIGFVM